MTHDVGTGIMAAPVSYAADGTQYIALMAGYGGPSAFIGGLTPIQPRRPGRLLVFKLGGTAQAPAYQADLMRAPFMTSPKALFGVLDKGSEMHRGMPSFTGLLSAGDIENIRAYVLHRAKQEQARATQ